MQLRLLVLFSTLLLTLPGLDSLRLPNEQLQFARPLQKISDVILQRLGGNEFLRRNVNNNARSLQKRSSGVLPNSDGNQILRGNIDYNAKSLQKRSDDLFQRLGGDGFLRRNLNNNATSLQKRSSEVVPIVDSDEILIGNVDYNARSLQKRSPILLPLSDRNVFKNLDTFTRNYNSSLRFPQKRSVDHLLSAVNDNLSKNYNNERSLQNSYLFQGQDKSNASSDNLRSLQKRNNVLLQQTKINSASNGNIRNLLSLQKRSASHLFGGNGFFNGNYNNKGYFPTNMANNFAGIVSETIGHVATGINNVGNTIGSIVGGLAKGLG
ncbi:hypothetical protein JTE90_001635 [Oedothorax gibbosus]|uniref:Uncharacterized protein n=1 Tax=Oedothorax gibbosus TaxID=931172 RepID=A0AAV6VQC4_9ARAC|nr:hypothetical protein JTE90_001635 [Oedothorax gibbosus]